VRVPVKVPQWLFVKGDPASIHQAIRLAPGTAEYYSALPEAEPDHAVAFLKNAVTWNALDASLRLELGLAEEHRSDFPGAEADLLEAMRLDTGLVPRSALSDFYFDRRDAAKFWPVTKAALAMSYCDVSAQFRNCWALTSDPQTILDCAIPDRPAPWRKYLDFLLNEGRPDAAAPVAGKALASVDQEAVPLLLHYCDRMLTQWRGEEALSVWNGLTKRQLIPAVSGHGFDQQISEPEGIHVDRTREGSVLRFSGNQPENTEMVSQYVPLMAAPALRLDGAPSFSGNEESGLFCKLLLADGGDLLHGRGLLPTSSFLIRTPENATLGRLVLGYRRTSGTTRIEGSLTLEQFALTLSDGL
jgi:hypothetical protein